jgi:hypothetical protein
MMTQAFLKRAEVRHALKVAGHQLGDVYQFLDGQYADRDQDVPLFTVANVVSEFFGYTGLDAKMVALSYFSWLWNERPALTREDSTDG